MEVNSGVILGTINDAGARIDDLLRDGYRGLRQKTELVLAGCWKNAAAFATTTVFLHVESRRCS